MRALILAFGCGVALAAPAQADRAPVGRDQAWRGTNRPASSGRLRLGLAPGLLGRPMGNLRRVHCVR